jgi:glutamate-1-semialdehyde 2,1-aminomutase
VYQAGTLSGNPLATAAGLAVLEELDEPSYRKLAATAERLGGYLRNAFADHLPVQVPVAGPLVGLFFSESPVTDYVGARASADTGLYQKWFHAMLDRGVAFAPGAYEVMFPSLAHTAGTLIATAEAAADAAASAAATPRF